MPAHDDSPTGHSWAQRPPVPQSAEPVHGSPVFGPDLQIAPSVSCVFPSHTSGPFTIWSPQEGAGPLQVRLQEDATQPDDEQ